jgi:hypothetical protein
MNVVSSGPKSVLLLSSSSLASLRDVSTGPVGEGGGLADDRRLGAGKSKGRGWTAFRGTLRNKARCSISYLLRA